jgi:hypothetical protein
MNEIKMFKMATMWVDEKPKTRYMEISKMNGLTRISLDEERKGIFEPNSIKFEFEPNPVIVEADEIKESEYNDFKKFIKKEHKEKRERCKINHFRGCGNHFARECLTDRGLEETIKEFRDNIEYFIEGMKEHLDAVKSYNDCPF